MLDSVEVISDFAFCYCRSLTSIVIPNSVTSLGSYAFDNCKLLTSVVIGDSVTSIGEEAIYNCSSLTSIKYCGSQTQWSAITKGSLRNYNTGNYTIIITTKANKKSNWGRHYTLPHKIKK